ncbi:alpha/beta fold hydrolase [Phyllobacterium sp. SYP-B3895]|uniref:alpha/beta hydrolase n=1 Tax=Phyllobacterium sp. SYP-B3895 TaxID=2663240 RepID=UPI001299F117|nr:alpha/beta hydrolase [Phyllobacterium sp. SYP-B3895]MRG56836.1 alpha/beta fold hydrolase [Phyllobacterium sp. SYP-B3895]
MAFKDVETIRTATGAALAVRVSQAEAEPCGIVQICHGVSEHSLRYARFAQFLSERGFHVYAHDHRGHGLTKAPGAPAGRFAQQAGRQHVLDDVDVVNHLARNRNPGLPLILFGHSMGGLVALNYILKHPENVSGTAIWNTNFSTASLNRLALGILRAERMLLGSDVPSMILPKLTFRDWARRVKNARTASDWLSRDPDEVDAYLADPLSGWDPTVSMWRDIFDFMNVGTNDALLATLRRNLPFNLVGGAEDPATAKGKSVKELEERLLRLGFTDVESRIYQDTRHEGLNEINRDEIMQDFASWALRVGKHSTKELVQN